MLEEIRTFLDSHPDVMEVDVISVDLPGKVFGKRYSVKDLEKLAAGQGKMPAAMHLMCAKGYPVPAKGYGFDDGDPDATFELVPGSLQYVGWESVPRAQVMARFIDPQNQGLFWEPRNVLQRVLKHLAAENYLPVVAFELEFYLCDIEMTAEGAIQPPTGRLTGGRDGLGVLAMERLSEFGDCLTEIVQRCAEQGVLTGPVSAELGPGQYEINLQHNRDVLAAADQCVMFQRIVRGVALKHGYRASFMAKPYLDQSGNGLHMHVSMYDRNGRNVLAGNDDEKLRSAVGGLLEVLPASMTFLAPNVNAFRRLQPGNNTPLTPNWGYENRSVAVRVPLSDAHNRRVEHRVAGADANPYLAMAVVLAGMHCGLDRCLDPGAPTEEICLDASGLPTDLRTAIALTEKSDALKEYLGCEFVEVFAAQRVGELKEFEHYISAREYDWYL